MSSDEPEIQPATAGGSAPGRGGAVTSAVPRLRVNGVSKHFDAVRALSDVSVEFAPGEIHALVGENGAGKSTLVGIITGLLEPDTGSLEGDLLALNREVRDALAGEQSRTVQIFLAPAGQELGDMGQTIVYAVETTEHRALEVQLAQSQKMQAIGQLAGGVAHDFNNVLTAIIGFSDLLLARHRPTDPAFADIMNIKQNANRAANLVRQLLAFSRRQTLRPEILSLTDAISDLGNLLGRLLGEKVGLKVIHGRDVGLVKIDIDDDGGEKADD
jgi:signal transduction histidine kinase